jgi:hypothetical protein
MKRLSRLPLIICGTAWLMSGLCWAQPETRSISQLKSQIEKLRAIDRDETTPPDVKEMNRRFLDKRLADLSSLLQSQADTLRKYQSAAGPSLTASENQEVEEKIKGLEKEARELASGGVTVPSSEPPARRSSSAATDIPTPAVAGPQAIAEAPTIPGKDTSLGAARSAGGAIRSSVTSPPVAGETNTQGRRKMDVSSYLGERINIIIKTKIDKSDNSKQAETPSGSENTTSLVDQSSASDLVGVGLTLAGLSATPTDGQNASSVSVTTTAYPFYAAIKGVDPLNPGFYNRSSPWRKLSFTLGYDDEMVVGGNGTTERAKLFGVKYLIMNERDLSNIRHREEIGTVFSSLEAATGSFGRIENRVKAYIFKHEKVMKTIIKPGFQEFLEEEMQKTSFTDDQKGEIQRLKSDDLNILFKFDDDGKLSVAEGVRCPDSIKCRETFGYYVRFANKYFAEEGFNDLLSVLDQEALDEIDKFIEGEIDPFRRLDADAGAAIEKIRTAPQFSLSVFTRQRGLGADEYRGEAIYDYGLANRTNLTLNAGFLYTDSKVIGGDTKGGRAAGQLRFQLTPEKELGGKQPYYFYLAGEGKWQAGEKPIYTGQVKITVPLADGLNLPLSLTVANRSDLIKETVVKGQLGFSFDASRVIQFFSHKP